MAIVGGISPKDQNIAFLVAPGLRGGGIGEPADDHLLAVLEAVHHRGALWSIYGGLISSVTLIIFSPVVSGKAVVEATGRAPSMLQGVDFHWFPLDNPGLISIPLAFLLGWLGSVTDPNKADADEVRRDGGPVP